MNFYVENLFLDEISPFCYPVFICFFKSRSIIYVQILKKQRDVIFGVKRKENSETFLLVRKEISESIFYWPEKTVTDFCWYCLTILLVDASILFH